MPSYDCGSDYYDSYRAEQEENENLRLENHMLREQLRLLKAELARLENQIGRYG